MGKRQKSPLDQAFEDTIKILHKAIGDIQSSIYKGMNELIADKIDIGKLSQAFSKLSGIGMPPQFDYYQILGLDKSASNEEVKKRYRDIMIKIHPDKTEGTHFLAQLVNIAYEAITKERGI